MAPIASSNKKGFTLIELMIAMVIISISMLAVLSSLLTAGRMNLENDVRNTAIRLTNQTAETLLSLQWARIAGVVQTDPQLMGAAVPGVLHMRVAGDAEQNAKGFPALTQNVRNSRQDYQIQWTIEDLEENYKRITVVVNYNFSGRPLMNTSVTYRHLSQ